MERISPIQKEEASPSLKKTYEDIEKKLGWIPNIFKNMGHSEAVLEGYLALSKASEKTSLSPALREQIALVVSEENHCEYCLSAHTAIGKNAGLTEEEILSARRGTAKDKKAESLLSFAKLIVKNRGNLNDGDLHALQMANISSKEMIETILVVILTIFTNYFNHITKTEVDFPKAPNLK